MYTHMFEDDFRGNFLACGTFWGEKNLDLGWTLMQLSRIQPWDAHVETHWV